MSRPRAPSLSISVPLRRLFLCAAAALPLAAAASAGNGIDSVRIGQGFASPLWAGSPPGDERIFVLEQNTGLVRILMPDGMILPQPFLDVGAKISLGGERGLLGLAFHPGYASNGRFFVVYTDLAGNTVLVERAVSADPDIADPTFEKLVLRVLQPFTHHNGGGIAFGPLDGYLYVALGDGGSGGDPFCNAQDMDSLLGKVLRIDVDGAAPYEVPSDNPFIGVPGARPEIWSLGLRNPWRLGFDSLTGDIYLGDVGDFGPEEIDFEPALAGGRNYGWPIEEGSTCKAPHATCVAPPACGSLDLTRPVHEYDHNAGGGAFLGCAVIGGTVYRGCAIAGLQGAYFFADYCSNKIWSLEVVGGAATNLIEHTFDLAPGGGVTINSITSFGLDGNGELLIVDQGGEIFRVVPETPPAQDCDGNGLDDACEIAADPVLDLSGDDVLDACQLLSADTAEISVSAGGTQTFSLHAGSAHAGKFHFLVGSGSGSVPGFPFGGFTIPLNPDGYFFGTLTSPDSPPLSNSFGPLDSEGDAAASFSLPAGASPALVGLTAHHAYAVLVPITFALDAVSQALPVAIVP